MKEFFFLRKCGEISQDMIFYPTLQLHCKHIDMKNEISNQFFYEQVVLETCKGLRKLHMRMMNEDGSGIVVQISDRLPRECAIIFFWLKYNFIKDWGKVNFSFAP